MPPQDNLGVGLAVLLSKSVNRGSSSSALSPWPRGYQAWMTMPSWLRNFFSSLLLEVGVHLGLQHGGLHLAQAQNFLHLRLD